MPHSTSVYNTVRLVHATPRSTWRVVRNRVLVCGIQQLVGAIAVIVASKEPCCQALIDETPKDGLCLATSTGAAVPYNSSSSCCYDLAEFSSGGSDNPSNGSLTKSHHLLKASSLGIVPHFNLEL